MSERPRHRMTEGNTMTESIGSPEYHATMRRLGKLVEPVAAGVYFAPEAHDAYAEHGLDFFEGYFCSRSACLGDVPWTVVCSAFAAFKPAAVEAAVTSGKTKADARTLAAARLAGATAQLERLVGPVAEAGKVARATETLFELTDGIDPSGRALFAGLSSLPRPGTALGDLWRAADLVREHRGDGHIAAWIGRTNSIEITLLTELAWGIPAKSYVFTRGWSADEIDAASENLARRGLITEGALTASGRELRGDIERATDLAERELYERLDGRADELFELLQPLSSAIVAGGGYPTDPSNLAISG
ncbi:MAG TPA: hypothetical protein VIC35_12420 [Acidimicrobiia bacterium]|jgi:hypothetical protein